ncbi:DUF2971 domain-containing protein [Listeria monocytogenes]|nr:MULTISPECIES: DUF2971 domain-containing protein [Listeria]
MIEDNNLYHFTSADTAVNFILKNETLKFSSFRYVNDPKESKSWPFKFYGHSIENKDKFKPNFFHESNDFIKDHWLVLCMTRANKEIAYDMKMWDSYGQKHKGICLVFDHKKLSKVLNSQTNNFLFEKEIHYTDINNTGSIFNLYSINGYFKTFTGINFPFIINYLKCMYNPFLLSNISNPFMLQLEHYLHIGKENYLKWHSIHFNKNLFFNKSLSWKDEKEYRYILYSNNSAENQFLTYKDSLIEVILGNDISIADRKKIKEVLKNKNIKISQLIYNNWHGSLFDITNSEENDNSVIDISTSFRVDVPQRFLFTSTNTKNGVEFLFFDWETGDVSVLPLGE